MGKAKKMGKTTLSYKKKARSLKILLSPHRSPKPPNKLGTTTKKSPPFGRAFFIQSTYSISRIVVAVKGNGLSVRCFDSDIIAVDFVGIPANNKGIIAINDILPADNFAA